MAPRQKIFLAYCYPDQKWLDRVRAALAPMAQEDFIVWDERKFRAGNSWRAELSNALAESTLAVMLVSDLFLDSDFIVRAKFPALLTRARHEGGPRVCWILVSHCLYQDAGLVPGMAMNDLDRPLDGISVSKREAAVAVVAAKLKALAAGETYVPPAPVAVVSSRKGKAAASAPRPGPAPAPAPASSPYRLPLATLIETRGKSVAELRRLERGLLWASLALLILSLLVAAARRNVLLLPLVAGFGVLIAALALVLRARTDLIAQSLIGIQYTRTGLEDDALPSRQRNLLKQRAGQLLGET